MSTNLNLSLLNRVQVSIADTEHFSGLRQANGIFIVYRHVQVMLKRFPVLNGFRKWYLSFLSSCYRPVIQIYVYAHGSQLLKLTQSDRAPTRGLHDYTFGDRPALESALELALPVRAGALDRGQQPPCRQTAPAESSHPPQLRAENPEPIYPAGAPPHSAPKVTRRNLTISSHCTQRKPQESLAKHRAYHALNGSSWPTIGLGTSLDSGSVSKLLRSSSSFIGGLKGAGCL